MQNLYQQMADSIDESVPELLTTRIAATKKKVVAVNRAYETVTGRSPAKYRARPLLRMKT